MIYAVGIDSDRTFVDFLAQATQRGVEVRLVNLRAVVLAGDWSLSIPDSGDSHVTALGERVPLDPEAAWFCRLIDLSSVQRDHALAVRWRGLVAALGAWLDAAPGVVVNRPSAQGHNFAKPFHEAVLARLGFAVPPSITASDGETLAAFASAGPAIVKTVSSMRGDARLVEPGELAQLDPHAGPVHLQRYVPGDDVRVHVVGDVTVAERIVAGGVDYRSADVPASYEPHEVPDELAERIVAATASFGLAFAGWDFKVDRDGRYWCLEANPMPGYHGYDRRLGRRITDALLRMLAGGRPAAPAAVTEGGAGA